jgi:hypothetical protein
MTKIRKFTSLLVGSLLVTVPSAAQVKTAALLVVALPEPWGLTEYVGFFALALLGLGILTRKGVLKHHPKS